jgi:transcriptional regulator with XRE-family HTH domain
MVDGGPNPTVSRLELAARLRELRQEAGRTIEDAAAELMCSVAKISRMETGGRGVQPRDVRDLCRLYGVPDVTRHELAHLLSQSKSTGWWQDFRSLDEQTATFIGLEDAATRLRIFDVSRLPGLLQIADYTRALIRDLRPPGELTESWIEDTVAARERRQKRVESGVLQVHAILDEAALSRPIGGADVMCRQIERLIAEAARQNVTLQMIPFDRGPHPGMEGSFQHMSLSEHRIDDVVYVEGLLGNFLLDKGGEVNHYRMIFDDLSSRFALDTTATGDWLQTRFEGWSALVREDGRRS